MEQTLTTAARHYAEASAGTATSVARAEAAIADAATSQRAETGEQQTTLGMLHTALEGSEADRLVDNLARAQEQALQASLAVSARVVEKRWFQELGRVEAEVAEGFGELGREVEQRLDTMRVSLGPAFREP